MPFARRRRAPALVEDEAALSGSDDSGDESSDDQETETDRQFIDDRALKRRRLPKLTEEEKVVSEDELDKLKDDVESEDDLKELKRTCVSICKGADGGIDRKPGRGYADDDDADEQNSSDCDWIEDDIAEMGRIERQVSKAVGDFVKKQGLPKRSPPAKAPPQPPAKKRRIAEKKKLPRTLSGILGPGFSISSVSGPAREADTQVAPMFSKQSKLKEAKSNATAATTETTKRATKQKQAVTPGLVLDASSGLVYYVHANGTRELRPNAL